MIDSGKYIINSMPRTGTTWLQFILSFTILSNPDEEILAKNWEKNLTRHASTSITPSKNFVLKMHNPIGLYAKYDDISQIYIARDPKSTIASVITKAISGMGETVSNGIVLPPELVERTTISSNIANQIGVYEAYAKSALSNLDRIKIYSFDSITNNIEDVIKNIFNGKNGKKYYTYNDNIYNFCFDNILINIIARYHIAGEYIEPDKFFNEFGGKRKF